MKLIISLVYPSPPTFILLGKKNPKKVYLTYNAIYAGANRFTRIKIVELLHSYLLSVNNLIPKIEEKVTVEFIYQHPGTNWDVGNKAGLWSKVFLDFIKGNKIKDDSVKYVGREIYDNAQGPHELRINIYKYERNICQDQPLF